ncbi:hypothetical protein F3Y22_tig00002799pilonHSYRG00181 [Hibiscus syriacus]|uniref:RING-type domain-containing protein n=1 Tax=Hibiscus syriacus TaxID=106335 RepID=A0A6A3CWM5_HIBSY|nr:hypothetical protein F3Y22_tig00002799pilonHSYRG00181 [Hibiscus syriacus]
MLVNYPKTYSNSSTSPATSFLLGVEWGSRHAWVVLPRLVQRQAVAGWGRGSLKMESMVLKGDLNQIITAPQNGCCPSYEFCAEKFDINPNHGQASACDLCGVGEDHCNGLKLYLGLSSMVAGRTCFKQYFFSPSFFPRIDWMQHIKIRFQATVNPDSEARLKHEEKAKEEILTRACLVQKEREEIEASTKLEEEMVKGIDGSYAGKFTDNRHCTGQKEPRTPLTVIDFHEFSGKGVVKRERECVMCLSEEMSVVFIPCAHQAVCIACNELHEKQGMKDCPSCRSPIQRRINVRYARS